MSVGTAHYWKVRERNRKGQEENDNRNRKSKMKGSGETRKERAIEKMG
jgi:hypothetical protein